MKFLDRCRIGPLLAAGMCALAVSSVRAEDLTGLAKSLSSLRSDVERLSSELAEQKGDLQDELRTLARQKSELALENDRESMRLQKLRMTLADKQKLIAAQQAESKVLMPAFEKVSEQVKAHIQSSLPFRTEERLAEVDKIRAQLAEGLFSPEQAVARLWALIEDEHRLTRENGLYRQAVTVDGSEQLVDVARIGMVMMYFRAEGARVGYAKRTSTGWTYQVVQSPEETKLIDNLFETFKKQIRVGYFELPNVGLGATP
jgi:hypothetical protein